MKSIVKYILKGYAVTIMAVFASLPVMAEDIEIYKASNVGGTEINPNIMFILDTSGSMDHEEPTAPPYDANVPYTQGGSTCFDANRMYIVSTSKIDACLDEYKEISFLKTQNKCLGAERAFAVATGQGRGTGIYNSTYAQWNDTNKYWGLLTNSSNTSFVIECKADMNEHGGGQPQKKCINTFDTSEPFTGCIDNSKYSWSSVESESVTMYDGNWLNYQLKMRLDAQLATPLLQVDTSYLDIMKQAIRTIVYSVDDVGIGLMRFDDETSTNGNKIPGQGGSVSYPIQDSDAGRVNMISQMNGWDHKGATPLSETLYEAYLYFSGSHVLFGDLANPSSTGESQLPGKMYKSPIDPLMVGCQKQYIVMLSDGEPSWDDQANTLIEKLPGFTAPGGNSTKCSANGSNGNGDCLDDLAGYMFSHGYDALVENAAGAMVTIEDVKTATYTIGFGGDIPILKETARVGGGEYHIATSATELLETFLNILSSVKDLHSTFSSPAVSVNAFNRTTHRNELYFTVFKPAVTPHWDGNFKRFKLEFDDLGVPSIQDQNSNDAINVATGFFKDDALSFWTAKADAPLGDGRDTSIGGSASKLNTVSGRKLFTALTTNDLNHNSNLVLKTTTGLKAKMGWDGTATSSAYYDKLVDWVRGADIDDVDGDLDVTEARRVMGDPLHAQPALIQYGGTDDNPDITSYVATNDGLLHAFSTATGEEQFAFLPPELLGKMDTLYKNSGSNKFYGLDGTVVPYIIDNNLDGIINGNDKVYIFFGMRRGGSNYYALDVTNRTSPKLLWTIRGGAVDINANPLVGLDATLGDYANLGQTWSTPSLRIVKLNNNDVPVLIFAAGYDIEQDSKNVRSADKAGRGIYIVNALTGVPLWRMGPDALADLTDSNMIYSIPSDVSSVDTNGDGYVDHLYVGDMGGQLWRVDIDNEASNAATKLVVTGGRIADLADATLSTNRRFYYPPSVAISKDADDELYTALVISSGNRARPTNRAVQDRTFMIRDKPVNGKPGSYTTLVVNDTTEDLYNTTANIIGQGSKVAQEAARTSLASSNGWYIDLSMLSAEKSITKALIFAGEIFFTTYEPFNPVDADPTSCEPQVGNGYLYHVYLSDGRPVKNYDTDVSADPDNLTKEDRRVQLARSGIPADPTVICTGDGCAQCVGTECDKLESAGTHKTIYWFEE